jgi:hypothetical protein
VALLIVSDVTSFKLPGFFYHYFFAGFFAPLILNPSVHHQQTQRENASPAHLQNSAYANRTKSCPAVTMKTSKKTTIRTTAPAV